MLALTSTAAIASRLTSWSCSGNTCTAKFSSGSSSTVTIPMMNIAPTTMATTDAQARGDDAPPLSLDFEQGRDDCDVDAEAVEAALEIKQRIDADGVPNSSTSQTEYGAVIADTGSGPQRGTVVQGQSYAQSESPSTNLTPSRDSIGATNAQIVGVIHSHGPGQTDEGNEANRRPSNNDWALADKLVQQGANPDRLTLYIIDKDGVLRAYRYAPPSLRTDTYPPADEISTSCM